MLRGSSIGWGTAGSIPAEVFGDSSGRLVVGSTQFLTEVTTRDLLWKEGRADNLTIFICRLSKYLWKPQPPGGLAAYLGLNRESFTFTIAFAFITVLLICGV